MSAPDPETALAPIPEVPSTARLAWLLFMQPAKLHREFTAWSRSFTAWWRSFTAHRMLFITARASAPATSASSTWS